MKSIPRSLKLEHPQKGRVTVSISSQSSETSFDRVFKVHSTDHELYFTSEERKAEARFNEHVDYFMSLGYSAVLVPNLDYEDNDLGSMWNRSAS